MTPILLGRVEAAALLGLTPRAVEERTRKGQIPHIRLGGRIYYNASALRLWARSSSR